VDARDAVLWWSAGVDAALQRVGRRWLPGMPSCEALGLNAPHSGNVNGDEPEIWRSGHGDESLEMAIRRRPIRSGPDGLTALEVRFLTSRTSHETSARDVQVSALGRLSVSVAGTSRDGDWLQQRPGQVFRYLLASRDGAQRSEAIASTLWPERGPSAVANVRYCIFKLREHLAEPGAPSESLVVRDAAGYRIDVRRLALDVDAFQAKYSAGIAAQRRGDSTDAEAQLGEAIALYSGEFLADDPYADWAFSEREYLRSLAGKALAALAQIALGNGRLVAAAEHLQRLAELEPFDSHVHQMLIEVCLRRGRRTEALRHYHALRARLHRAFGEQPDFEMTSVAARAQQHRQPRLRPQRLDTAVLDTH